MAHSDGRTISQERKEWTNVQWARHLGCNARKLPQIREKINGKYRAFIGVTPDSGVETDGKWHFYIMENMGVWRTTFYSKEGFSGPTEMAEFAEEEIIPNLEMNPFFAKQDGVPIKAWQMLKMNGGR